MFLRNAFRFCMAPDDGGAGGTAPAAAQPHTPTPPADGDDMLDVGDGRVRSMTKYERGLRGKLTAAETAAAEAARLRDEGVRAAQAERDAAVASAKADADKRIIRAELKSFAVKAGLRDLSDLNSADLSSLKLNDAGDVEGAEAFIASLKEAKPHWFADSETGAATGSTTSTAKTPSGNTGKPRHAREMTQQEYDAELKALTNRR